MNQALFVFYALTVIALFCAFYLIPTFLRWKAANSLTSGDGDKAIDAFSKALKMSPRDAKIWFGLAVGLRRLKCWDESLLALDAVQRLSPFKTPSYTELKGISTTYTNDSSVRVYQNLSGLKVKRLLLTKKNQKAFSVSR